MKKYRVLIMAIVFALSAMLMEETSFAAEPYEKIANTQEWEILKIVNKERLKDGKKPLSIFSSLQKASGIRAKELIEYYSHTRPDGTECFTAMDDCDVNYSWGGENIAAGFQTPATVMDAWMNSPGHRENILSSNYTHIGVGYAEGGYYGKNWAQMFVGKCNIKSVALNDVGTPNYAVGTTIDKMNRYLIIRCDCHGTSYAPVISKMCKGYKSNKKGYQTITVNYCGKKVKMQVTVGKSSAYKPPAQVKSLRSTAKTKTSVSLKWNKRSGKGYELWMATSKNGTYKQVKNLTSSKKTSYKVKNLKSGKKYYFKVRAYKKSGNKKIYGPFSKAVVVKT